jgi:hypothetical protein
MEVSTRTGENLRSLFRCAVKAALDPASFAALHSPEVSSARIDAVNAAEEAVFRVVDGADDNDDDEDNEDSVSSESSSTVGTWPGGRRMSSSRSASHSFGDMWSRAEQASEDAYLESLFDRLRQGKSQRQARKPLSFTRGAGSRSRGPTQKQLQHAIGTLAQTPSVQLFLSTGHVGSFRAEQQQSGKSARETGWRRAYNDDGLMHWWNPGSDSRRWVPPAGVVIKGQKSFRSGVASSAASGHISPPFGVRKHTLSSLVQQAGMPRRKRGDNPSTAHQLTFVNAFEQSQNRPSEGAPSRSRTQPIQVAAVSVSAPREFRHTSGLTAALTQSASSLPFLNPPTPSDGESQVQLDRIVQKMNPQPREQSDRKLAVLFHVSTKLPDRKQRPQEETPQGGPVILANYPEKVYVVVEEGGSSRKLLEDVRDRVQQKAHREAIEDVLAARPIALPLYYDPEFSEWCQLPVVVDDLPRERVKLLIVAPDTLS